MNLDPREPDYVEGVEVQENPCFMCGFDECRCNDWEGNL